MKFLEDSGIIRSDIYMAASMMPILGLALLDPDSFSLGWNEGRGGFVFALFFLLMEWYDARRVLRLREDKTRFTMWALCLLGFVAYFVAVYAFDLHGFMGRIGQVWNVPELHSWVWLWDYFVLAAFLFCLVSILFGSRSFKEIPTPIVYAVGSGLILLLDSFFPYGSISFLAGLVPLIANLVVLMLGVSGVHVMKGPFDPVQPPSVYLTGELLWIRGLHGTIVLQINWPCMGIFSMLIYALITTILMIKLQAPRRRKLLYVTVGAIGTFFVNVFRIFLIAFYVTFISIDVKIFHENIGEFLFLIWVVAFLLIVVKVESRLTRASGKIDLSKKQKIVEPAKNI